MSWETQFSATTLEKPVARTGNPTLPHLRPVGQTSKQSRARESPAGNMYGKYSVHTIASDRGIAFPCHLRPQPRISHILDRHTKGRKGGPDGEQICPRCQACFESEESLRAHINMIVQPGKSCPQVENSSDGNDSEGDVDAAKASAIRNKQGRCGECQITVAEDLGDLVPRHKSPILP
jgi:hypothetical protein